MFVSAHTIILLADAPRISSVLDVSRRSATKLRLICIILVFGSLGKTKQNYSRQNFGKTLSFSVFGFLPTGWYITSDAQNQNGRKHQNNTRISQFTHNCSAEAPSGLCAGTRYLVYTRHKNAFSRAACCSSTAIHVRCAYSSVLVLSRQHGPRCLR